MFDEERKLTYPGIMKAQGFIIRCYTPFLAGIITTNYDTLIETALGTELFNYGIKNQILKGRGPYPFYYDYNNIPLKGYVPIAKIHGSISWDEKAFYTDGRRGLTGNALIIAPTPEKQIPESLKSVWNIAEGILEKAERIAVFGFSFNSYDVETLNLLRIYGKKIKTVLIIDIDPKMEQAKQLWPKATIFSCPPPPTGNEDIYNWLYEDKI